MGITGDWDQRISRRTLLKTGGSFAASVTVIGALWTRAFATPPFAGNPFSLGIASGDPTPNGVVLWTRLAPEPLIPGGGMKNEVYGVRYEVAEDEDFRDIIRRGAIEAVPDEAHSVRVELDDLEPRTSTTTASSSARWSARTGARAPRPRTRAASTSSCSPSCRARTSPTATSRRTRRWRTPTTSTPSCTSATTSTRARRRPFRKHEPLREIFSLDDYRIRHGQYKTDVHLQAAHAAHPWLVTWDDHEFKNNYADLDLDPDVPVEVAIARRTAAYRAYWEHMPLRRSRKPDGPVLPALPPLPLGRPRHLQRARRAPVPLRPAGRVHARAADAERLLPVRARARSHHARRRAARLAARGARHHDGALERARQPDRVRAVRQRPERHAAAASGRATTGTATSPSGSSCSTGWSPSARRTRS